MLENMAKEFVQIKVLRKCVCVILPSIVIYDSSVSMQTRQNKQWSVPLITECLI